MFESYFKRTRHYEIEISFNLNAASGFTFNEFYPGIDLELPLILINLT